MPSQNYISTDGKLIRNITNSIEKLCFLKNGKIIAEKKFDQPGEIHRRYMDYIINFVLEIGDNEVFTLPETSKNIRLNNAVKETYNKLRQEA